MKQQGRDAVLFWILFALKIVTTVMTGRDTLIVTGGGFSGWLAVILIDLAFFSLWSYLAYAGEGKDARRNKAYAAVGAWGLYGAMFVIGLKAHSGEFWAVAVRLSGLIALGFDTWQFTSTLAVNAAQGVRSWLDARREYRLDIERHELDVLQARSRRSIRRSGRKLQAHLDTLVMERMRARLTGDYAGNDTPIVQVNALPVTVDETDLSTDERRERVADIFRSNPAVSKADLARRFSVARNTIYSDLDALGLR